MPGIGGNPHERFSFAPAFSEWFFKSWVVPACQIQGALQESGAFTENSRRLWLFEISCWKFPANFDTAAKFYTDFRQHEMLSCWGLSIFWQGKWRERSWISPLIGNGRNTVSRVLFRRRELTEPHWVLGQLGEFCNKTRWVRFFTQIIGWEELIELSPWNSARAKKLAEFGVWNRTLRNRIRPFPRVAFSCSPGDGRSFLNSGHPA